MSRVPHALHCTLYFENFYFADLSCVSNPQTTDSHLVTISNSMVRKRTRRDFLSLAGKSLGLAALSSATVASLLERVEAATKTVAHLTPEEAALDEDYWAGSQKSFTVTR